MIANGADVSEVREQLGHANIATTSIYLNLHGEDTVKKSLERAAAAFGAEDAA
jgi:site-specific recombinase XerD